MATSPNAAVRERQKSDSLACSCPRPVISSSVPAAELKGVVEAAAARLVTCRRGEILLAHGVRVRVRAALQHQPLRLRQIPLPFLNQVGARRQRRHVAEILQTLRSRLQLIGPTGAEAGRRSGVRRGHC